MLLDRLSALGGFDVISLRSHAVFHGPNPYSADPVLVLEIRIQEEALDTLLQAIEPMQAQSADWFQPSAGLAAPSEAEQLGAFLVDWAYQALTYVRGHPHARGCTQDSRTGQILAWLGFHDLQISQFALGLAAKCLNAFAHGQTPSFDGLARDLNQLWQACQKHHPDYQADIVMRAARRRGIPFAPAWGLIRHWRYGQGARSRVLFESSSCTDGHFGARIARSKAMSKTVLRSLGLPTPRYRLITHEHELEHAVRAVGFPCVTKPLDRGGGKGVSAGLNDLAAARRGFSAARAASAGPVMVEAHVVGDDHRLMVVDGRLVAAIRRDPPSVTGDGRRSIAELVREKNLGRDPRSLVCRGYRRPIILDESARLHLGAQGLSPETVLKTGRVVRLRSNANLSTGGDCIDVTAQLHPDVRVMAETLATTLNLPMMGADYMTTDIASVPAESAGQFIEINTTPGLDAMIAAGWSVEDAGDLALGGHSGRIPVELLIVPMQALDEAVERVTSAQWEPCTGWATYDQAGLGAVKLVVDGGSPWAGVNVLLSHRSTSRAMLVAGDLEVVQHGLPLDRCHVVHLLTELPSAWMAVLDERCTEVRRHHRAAGDALTALRDIIATPAGLACGTRPGLDLRNAHNAHRQIMSISRAERERHNGHKGMVIWFTGLSGAGKSTLANALEEELHAQGKRTYILDGDNVRQGLSKDLGFTDADRVENIRRIAEVARLMMDAGLITLTAFISPFRADREMARQLIGESNFMEVFVDTPIEVCELRDPKGLYKKARSGQLPNMTGIDSFYEPPERPWMSIRTPELSISEAVKLLVQKLRLNYS